MANCNILRCLNVIFFFGASVFAHAASPQRIISLSPSITELIYEMGAGDKVVGVSAYSDYPKEALKKAMVASSAGVNLELIIQLKPDLIFAEEGEYNKRALARLIEWGYSVHRLQNRRLEDIPNALLKLGVLIHKESQAKRISNNFLAKLKTLSKQKEAIKNKPKVFYQIAINPLMTEAGNALVPEIIERCGGESLFSALPEAAPAVSIEAVLENNPDLIISSFNASEVKNFWKNWGQINAVKRNQIYYIAPELLQRATSRILEGMGEICKIVRIANSTS